jgi:hypothetical protein
LPNHQEPNQQSVDAATKKARFVLTGVVKRALTSSDANWKARRLNLLELCKNTLLSLQSLMEQAPHDESCLHGMLKHFSTKLFYVSSQSWFGIQRC